MARYSAKEEYAKVIAGAVELLRQHPVGKYTMDTEETMREYIPSWATVEIAMDIVNKYTQGIDVYVEEQRKARGPHGELPSGTALAEAYKIHYGKYMFHESVNSNKFKQWAQWKGNVNSEGDFVVPDHAYNHVWKTPLTIVDEFGDMKYA